MPVLGCFSKDIGNGLRFEPGPIAFFQKQLRRLGSGGWAECESSLCAPCLLRDPQRLSDSLHGSPTPFSAPVPSLWLQPGGLGQQADTLRPGDRPVHLPAARDGTGL